MPVIRSLGAAGVPVHAVGAPEDPVRYSRYCTSYSSLPEYRGGDDRRWLDWLETAGPAGGGVIMPCSDRTVELVARNRGALERRGYTPFELDDELALAMLDKDRTYELAKRAGVATPAWSTVRTREDAASALDELPFPCAVKPLASHEFTLRTGRRDKLFVVRSRGELEQRLAWLLDHGIEAMITEIVPGGDDRLVAHVVYMGDDGEPLLQYTDRKIRQDPAHFGVGAYVISDWDEEVVAAGLRFCRGVGLRGVAHVEFKRDTRDGTLRLIECNYRFHLAIGLAKASGLDFPLFTYNRLTGRPAPEPAELSPGVRQWRPIADARALPGYRRSGEWPLSAWVRTLFHPQRFTVFSWRDPKPSLVVNSRWARKQGRRSLARAARRLRARVRREPQPVGVTR